MQLTYIQTKLHNYDNENTYNYQLSETSILQIIPVPNRKKRKDILGNND